MNRATIRRILVAAAVAMTVFAAEVLAGSIPVMIASFSVVTATEPDSQSVQEFLKEYESTMARGRAHEIARMYRGADSTHEGVLKDYFENVVRDFEVHLENVSIDVEQDQAVVSFERTDQFTDRESGDRIQKSLNVERKLLRHGKSWQIALGAS